MQNALHVLNEVLHSKYHKNVWKANFRKHLFHNILLLLDFRQCQKCQFLLSLCNKITAYAIIPIVWWSVVMCGFLPL